MVVHGCVALRKFLLLGSTVLSVWSKRYDRRVLAVTREETEIKLMHRDGPRRERGGRKQKNGEQLVKLSLVQFMIHHQFHHTLAGARC